MPDEVDLANEAMYPDTDNMMGMAGPPPAKHGDPYADYTGPRGPKGEPDRRTKEGRAYLGLTPPTGPKGRARAATAPGKKPAPRPAARTSQREDYRPRILGVLQLVALPLAFKAPADGAAVEMHAPNIAQALHDLAMEQPEVAAVLDRILKVGPYGALLTAVVPLLLQLAANHGAVPAGIMGTVPPDVLLAHYRAAMEAEMGAMAG